MRNLISVPLFHVTGCNSQLLPTLQPRAAPRSIMPAFEVGRFLRAIVEERIRVVTTVPAIFWYALSRSRTFADFDLSGVRLRDVRRGADRAVAGRARSRTASRTRGSATASG